MLLSASLSLAGCAIVGNLPSHELVDGGPTALHTGTLVREGECLLVVSDLPFSSRYLVIWPVGYSLVGNQVVQGGTVKASVGQLVQLGGGEYKSATYEFVKTLLVTEIPQDCRANDFWLATTAHPAP